MKSPDFIIVGQGLAGTVLALTLLHRGHRIMIIDKPELSNSSKIAAGLYNPVVFKRLTKSWLADETIPAMQSFFAYAEKLLNEKFFYSREIVKIFADQNEKDFWKKKCGTEMIRYLDPEIKTDWLPGLINNPEGVAEIKDCGNLDVLKFLNSAAEFFSKQGILLNEKFDNSLLNISGSDISYKGYSAKKLIFCEGHLASLNPYFSWLPFNLTKGEVITIRLDSALSIPMEKVINKMVFILPLGNNTYRVGATYKWDRFDEAPTEDGKAEITERLEKVLKVPYTIIAHDAGVRPTVNDRRPLIGSHPFHNNIAIFNGMGSKTVMLSPYFAANFADSMEGKGDLDPEADIARFEYKTSI
jgi:glycine/D-amino acid oxidase-like deaminating enzyme